VIDDPRGRIDYEETGQGATQGPTVVLVPGSCSTGAAWRPLMSHWKSNFRCITTSLLGYGGTAERSAAIPTSRSKQRSSKLLSGAPAAVCIWSAIPLAGLQDLPSHYAIRNRSLTIVEAPAPEILRHVGEQEHYSTFRDMTLTYFAAFRSGQSNAIERMIDFYGGLGTFAGWPQRVRDYAVETTSVSLLDWSSAYGFAVTPALLKTITTPTLVVRGEKSHPAVKRANELVAQSIPGRPLRPSPVPRIS
jgi:pimeloyl-ACP methyl ester carboxylesterase